MTVVQLPPTSGGWPQPPAAAAFYGLAGRVVETIAPFSEADPVAILADLLVAFGCAVGTGPHAMVPATATGAHIAIVANITLDELRREMTSGEGENGFANRFLWLLVRRSKLLPEPPAFTGPIVDDLALRLAESLAAAEKIGQIRRDP